MRLRPLGHSHKPWRELQWQTFPFGVAGSNSNGNGVSKRGALVVKPPLVWMAVVQLALLLSSSSCKAWLKFSASIALASLST